MTTGRSNDNNQSGAVQLNTQHLAEVLSLLIPKPGARGGAEKRRATRVHVEAAVTIWHITDGLPGPATKVLTRDLSFSGIGFLQTMEPNPSGEFMLRLPRIKSDPVLLLCRITFTKPLADSLYVVGGEFIRLLPHEKAVNSPGPATADADADTSLEFDAKLLQAAKT